MNDSVPTDDPVVEFGELPPPNTAGRGRRPAWLPIAEQLKAQPGQWAKIATKPTAQTADSFVGAIRIGRLVAFPCSDFQAARRGCDVWVRYVGDQR